MQQLTDCAGGLRLRDILPDARFFGGDDVRVQSCCSDWRSCQPGDVYVALVGSESDGHDQVDLAVKRGAIAVVGERLLPARVPNCIVPDSREAYGHMCQRLAGQPDRHLQTIGVTGTLGKTTTSVLIASVLAAARQSVGMLSSLEHYDGELTEVPQSTTPAPPELARQLARMVTNGCSHAVLEVSSAALASRHLAGLSLDAAVLTNLGRDHLDWHGSLENYQRAKRRIFEHLNQRGFAVVNADNQAAREMAAQLDVPVMTVGMQQPAELQAQLIERCASEQTFLLIAGNESVPVRTRTVGDWYISSCLCAAALGLVLGIDLPTVVRGLEQVEHVPGRLERVECGQPFTVVVDQARNAEALAASLRTFRSVTAGRVLCVFGPPHWLSGPQRAALGYVAEKGADVPVITSTHPGYEQPLQMAHDVLDGVTCPGNMRVIPDRTEAIRWALAEARPGDTVLIAGKGSDSYQIVAAHRLPLDDRQVAQQWLYGRQPVRPRVTSTAILPMRLGCQWN
jgi:UDP-N-acetylmuramoyl-L-alanyl-D-glutamate--2,6-diaminopimelate ligase